MYTLKHSTDTVTPNLLLDHSSLWRQYTQQNFRSVGNWLTNLPTARKVSPRNMNHVQAKRAQRKLWNMFVEPILEDTDTKQ